MRVRRNTPARPITSHDSVATRNGVKAGNDSPSGEEVMADKRLEQGSSEESQCKAAGRFFKGFERSDEFEGLYDRLQTLEKWLELAVRPKSTEVAPDDRDMLLQEIDDIPELQRRCLHTRELMNAVLPPIEKIELWDSHLIPKQSYIPDAGLGLFYLPPKTCLSPPVIPKGTVICYYTGYLHNFQSSKTLKDNSYLMMVQGSVLVDPLPVESIKARYLNDPLNEMAVNCKYVPDELRAAIVVNRDILPGEELFASYGDIYWSQRKTTAKQFHP